MKNVKLIIITVLIVLYSMVIYANNEIIEKEGNTTKIKLMDDIRTKSDKLLGYVPSPTSTKNFKMFRENHDYQSSYNESNTNQYSKYTYFLLPSEADKLLFFNIEDKEQNLASISEIKKLEFREDDTYYYFDFDIIYNASDVWYDNGYNTGNGLQKINYGNLYLTNNPINELSYSYSVFLNTKKLSSIKLWGSSSNTSGNVWAKQVSLSSDNFEFNNRVDNLSLTINGLKSEQEMTMVSGSSFSIDNKNISYSNNTSRLYSTLKLPYEDYLDNTINKSNYNIKSSYTRLIRIQNKINQQILFTNGQNNYIYPQKITEYNPISHTATFNEYLNNWNNRFTGTIKIKKTDFENYRYLNMYCPNAIIVNDTGFTQNVSGFNLDFSSDISVRCGGRVNLNLYNQEANSVRSAMAIDLGDYMCKHEYRCQMIDNIISHDLICSLCGKNKSENHDFIYEYDGIPNNLCKCGYCYRIHNRYEYNSKDTVNIDNIVVASSSYTKPNIPVKEGYIFTGYKQFIKVFAKDNNPVFDKNNTVLTEKYVKDITDLPDISNYYSTRYEAKYVPIQYKVIFNNENNLNINFNHEVSELCCDYDTEYNVPEISIDGYNFIGWSKATISETVLLDHNSKILNLTNINNDKIVLYPIFVEIPKDEPEKPQDDNKTPAEETQIPHSEENVPKNDSEIAQEETTKKITAVSGNSGGSGSSGNYKSNLLQSKNSATTTNTNMNIVNTEPIKKIVKTSSVKQQNNKSTIEISKTLIMFIKEIFFDFVEQNNIKNESTTTISSLMGKIYNDFKRNNKINE